jgi:hypothetical protein
VGSEFEPRVGHLKRAIFYFLSPHSWGFSFCKMSIKNRRSKAFWYLLTPAIRNADIADQVGFSPIKNKNGPTPMSEGKSGLRPPPPNSHKNGHHEVMQADLGRKRITVRRPPPFLSTTQRNLMKIRIWVKPYHERIAHSFFGRKMEDAEGLRCCSREIIRNT